MYGSFRRLCRALTAVCLVSFSTAVAAQTAAQATKPDQKAPAAGTLPSARSIIDRHIEAIGGRKALAALNSHRIKGKMEIPANGISATMEVLSARPDKTIIHMNVPGMGEMSEGFDGTARLGRDADDRAGAVDRRGARGSKARGLFRQ